MTKREGEMKLKPCPFCGGRAGIFEFHLVPDPKVKCTKCECQTMECETREQAVELWNRRRTK